MLDDEEGVPEPEGQRGDIEEVEGHDPFPMVSQESQPALGRIAAAPQAPYPLSSIGWSIPKSKPPCSMFNSRLRMSGANMPASSRAVRACPLHRS
jgi:hypothetical protein